MSIWVAPAQSRQLHCASNPWKDQQQHNNRSKRTHCATKQQKFVITIPLKLLRNQFRNRFISLISFGRTTEFEFRSRCTFQCDGYTSFTQFLNQTIRHRTDQKKGPANAHTQCVRALREVSSALCQKLPLNLCDFWQIYAWINNRRCARTRTLWPLNYPRVSLCLEHKATCIAQANGEIDLCGRPMRTTDTPEQIYGR